MNPSDRRKLEDCVVFVKAAKQLLDAIETTLPEIDEIRKCLDSADVAYRCASCQLLFHSAVHILERAMPKEKKKDPAAVALGRRGGLKSRVNLTPEEREKLAKKAAAARWGKKKPTKGE